MQAGDRIIVRKSDDIPERGAIVVFDDQKFEQFLIKRVIGLPGERVAIKDNLITIYNKHSPDGFVPQFDTEYPLPSFSPGAWIDRQLSQNEIFVLGDNRPGQILDNTTLDNVPLDSIEGVVIYQF